MFSSNIKKNLFWAKKHFNFSKCFYFLAVWTGLEPATPCVTGMYSNQLNYQTSANFHLFFIAKAVRELDCECKYTTLFDSCKYFSKKRQTFLRNLGKLLFLNQIGSHNLFKFIIDCHRNIFDLIL